MEGSFDLGVGIPDEIMDYIFLRIPANDLWQRRTVCLNRRQRIWSPYFINSHLVESKLYISGLIFEFWCERRWRSFPYNGTFIDDGSPSQSVSIFQPHPSINVIPNYTEVVGVRHGLVCTIYEKR